MSNEFRTDKVFAQEMDAQDPLKQFRDEFFFPQHDGRNTIYFTGNSLGLQPKASWQAMKVEFDDWARFGVEGHFKATNPWYSYHERFTVMSAVLVGARPEEVVLMNGLTTDLQLLLISFYRPKGKRVRILCEAKAFPSDRYALASQARLHGLDPEEVIVEMSPREGEHTLRMDDILFRIQQEGEQLALIMIGGVNYFTGQAFDLSAITKAGHGVGAMVGFDLAHAAGNIPLHAHDDGYDFAAWCTYKYLNSGPGSVGGCFVHERHLNDPNIPRLEGWWGHDKQERFKMEKKFRPMPTAEAWQLSNAPVFSMAPHYVALEQFTRAGMDQLRAKSLKLTAYLDFTIDHVARETGAELEVITPRDPAQRGCQLSVIAHGKGRDLFEQLTASGVFIDWREPNVLRMAPVPMYNNFMDVFEFGGVLHNVLSA